MSNIDFSKYLFRASQVHLICGGNIGLSESQKNDMSDLIARKIASKNGELDDKGKPVKPLTHRMEETLTDLIKRNKEKQLPKTMITELRKIYRSEKYNRNFEFTNKFVQKGLHQEEEAITLYQKWRNENGIKTFFVKNTRRLNNDFVTGEPDLSLGNDIVGCEEGFDIKNSFSLESFTFKDDPLDFCYEMQNMVYMWLTGAKKWTTAYCLVNCTEHQLHLEKQKWYYALGLHDTAGKSDEAIYRLETAYEEKARMCERKYIYDYDRFIHVNPGHQMEYTRDEWHGEGLDIPLQDRVIEKVSVYDEEKINLIKERIKLAREVLSNF